MLPSGRLVSKRGLGQSKDRLLLKRSAPARIGPDGLRLTIVGQPPFWHPEPVSEGFQLSCPSYRQTYWRASIAWLLLDHFIGAGEQHWRDDHAELSGGFEVDEQLVLRRLFNRQVGGLRTIENFDDERCRTPAQIRDVRPIGNQPTVLDKFPPFVHRRKSMHRSKLAGLAPRREELRVSQESQGIET